LVGLLTLAGLTACGDKVTVPTPTSQAPGTVVHSVTVTPTVANLGLGDKISLAASVDADAGVTNRTVTWTSSNTAIASVDASGLVTAVAAGTTTIVAKSVADPAVQGSALITVAQGAPATVTISNVNTTRCDINGGCTSVPANLGSVAGQIDVTLNVDPGNARLLGVDLIMNCTGAGNSSTDTVVVSQTLATANVAPEASEASAPVTLSFNTATFNTTTGAPAFRNGACTIKACARTSAGNTVSTSQTLTLANQDVIIGSVASTKTAIRASDGLLWNGGDVTVTATPVLFSNRTPASLSVTFAGKTQTLTGTGAQTATFTDGNGANAGGATDIDGLTLPAATASFSLVDANGQPVVNPASCGATAFCSSQSYLANPLAPVAIATVRLDTQKPAAGTLAITSNTFQNTGSGYINPTFRFASDSAAGYTGPNAGSAVTAGNGATICAGNNGTTNPVTCNLDNGGVDNVTVTFQTRVTGAAASTYAARTTAAGLAETASQAGSGTSYQARMITVDALGNADTSAALPTSPGTTFGVDATAPSLSKASGPANKFTATTIGGAGTYAFNINDTTSTPGAAPSAPATSQLVAQVILNQGVNSASSISANNTTSTGPTAASLNTGCIVGRWNRTSGAANASPNALPVFDQTGTQIGTCSPILIALASGAPLSSNVAGVSGYVTTRVIALDQAGNQSAPFTSVIAEDTVDPTLSSIDMPATIAGNSTVAFTATAYDNLDVVTTAASIAYPSMTLRYPNVAVGTAFDNFLTDTTSVQATVTNFIRFLAQAGAGSQPASTTPNATSVQLTAADVVGRTSTLPAVPFAPAVSLTPTETSSSFSSNFQGFTLTADNSNTVWNCPAATTGQTTGCGAAGTTTPTNTSITFTAQAAGTTAVFLNPFTTVTFWYQNTGGAWVQISPTSASTSVSDDGTFRRWMYNFTWDPPAAGSDATSFVPAPGGTISLPIRAIGVNGSGDALYTSNAFTLTIQN